MKYNFQLVEKAFLYFYTSHHNGTMVRSYTRPWYKCTTKSKLVERCGEYYCHGDNGDLSTAINYAADMFVNNGLKVYIHGGFSHCGFISSFFQRDYMVMPYSGQYGEGLVFVEYRTVNTVTYHYLTTSDRRRK